MSSLGPPVRAEHRTVRIGAQAPTGGLGARASIMQFCEIRSVLGL
jgi:hypothetical protein